MLRAILFCLLTTASLFSEALQERAMVIVIPSFNNQDWYRYNVQNALNQNYKNFRIIYINDCSNDGTGEKVAALAQEFDPDSFSSFSFDNSVSDIAELTAKFKGMINREKNFFTLINNQNRSGALQNLYLAIHSCDDHEIIITLDGDDWFPDYEVLNRLNQTYASREIWLTHGTMIEYPSGYTGWCIPVPGEHIINNTIRQCRCPTHLRSFYAWLFKKIRLADLLHDGRFLPVTWDMAMMFPMLEMAAERHAFISEINYVYNRANPINDDKVNTQFQRDLDWYVRHMQPYQRLEKAP